MCLTTVHRTGHNIREEKGRRAAGGGREGFFELVDEEELIAG